MTKRIDQLPAAAAATLATLLASYTGGVTEKLTLTQVKALLDTYYAPLITRQTLTDAASISWNVANGVTATVTLGGNRTLANPTNLRDGASYALIVKQDATGSRTLAYGTAFKWPSGAAPVLSTAANAIDLLTFIYDGTNLYGNIAKAFA